MMLITISSELCYDFYTFQGLLAVLSYPSGFRILWLCGRNFCGMIMKWDFVEEPSQRQITFVGLMCITHKLLQLHKMYWISPLNYLHFQYRS